jgi:DNA-binding MarR family transcriptional regulator
MLLLEQHAAINVNRAVWEGPATLHLRAQAVPARGRSAYCISMNEYDELMEESSAATDRRVGPDLDPGSSLVDAIFRLQRAITRIGNARLLPWRMSLSSYTALRIISNRPYLTTAQLARRGGVRPQTMSRMVAELESRGFLARRMHPDSQRAIALSITPEGLKALYEMTEEVKKAPEALLRVMGTAGVERTDENLRLGISAVEAELKEIAADRLD